MESSSNRYSINEEIANSITHGIGVVLAIGALCILATFAGIYGNPWYSYNITHTVDQTVIQPIFGLFHVICSLLLVKLIHTEFPEHPVHYSRIQGIQPDHGPD